MSNGLAHGLPSSSLTFSRDLKQVNLTISFPLEDLIIASAGFKALEHLAANNSMPEKLLASLDTYLKAHFEMRHDSTHIPFTLESAYLEMKTHHDVGTYVSVVSELRLAISKGESVFPMNLRYDALMHEIRTHRANVYWLEPGLNAQRMAGFGFYSKGKNQGVLIQKPVNPP
ncbi:hypothetical protein [Paraglaciecola chathamensis]|uniref:hypothetical protein n=1 Tax=Paraglaciecola chathamensis TaxID=368405 RepID=UPI00270C3EFF|nr:hypothetical protein [Paraglaciecola chathamensis]MDO6557820.1 hypothetical protein [Paraglaciecola chathamensis]